MLRGFIAMLSFGRLFFGGLFVLLDVDVENARTLVMFARTPNLVISNSVT
jgi:hypothetical protein